MEPADVSLRLLQFLGLIIPLTFLTLELAEEKGYGDTHQFSSKTQYIIRVIFRKDAEYASLAFFILWSVVALSISAILHLLGVLVSLVVGSHVIYFVISGIILSVVGMLIMIYAFYSTLEFLAMLH